MALGALAEVIGGAVEGDAARSVGSVASPEEAQPSDLTFLHSEPLPESRGGMAIVDLEVQVASCSDLIRVADPKLGMLKALETLFAVDPPPAGLHATAVVDPSAQLAEGVSVGPHVWIGPGAEIGAGSLIMHGCSIGAGARIGEGGLLHPRVVLYPGVSLGRQVIVHAGAVIGADGFGYLFHEGQHAKIPQVGTVVVEDGVEIGANATIDCATLGETRIGAGSKIDNLVQIGHNVQLGALSILCSQVGIGGTTKLGVGVVLGGQVGVSDHATIGDQVKVGAQAGVLAGVDIPPGAVLWGTPARPHREVLRLKAAVRRLPKLARDVRLLIDKSKESEA